MIKKSSETWFGFSRPLLSDYQSQYQDQDGKYHSLNVETKTETEILSVS